ncbi:MAG: hypothetical protein EP333_05930 [Bacteroidetes bacterium]|nr:MAG: hypothetical protein EP333_05930 [Bacteroidota bacterium]TNF28246.1 MAG: hypothetical protein EP319_09410 [Deltaproteobacteria bacterium]
MRLFILIATSMSILHVLGQKSRVDLVVEPSHVEVGESVRITVTATVNGKMEVDNLPSSFVQDYNISQGSQDEIDYTTGEVKTIYFYSFSGVITKAGKYKIGPVYIKNLNKVYTSNTVTIQVDPKSNLSSTGEITKKQLKDPAFGVIAANKTELYEGEPLILSAKVYSHFDPSHISGYLPYDVPGAITKHPLGNMNNIKVSRERVLGTELYAFDYDKNLVFPSGVGKVTIEPFQLNLHQGYQSFPVNSGSFNVIIKSLPKNAPGSFIGAVGKFSMQASIDSLKIKQGNVFTYTVTIHGTGNLMNFNEPRPVLPKGFIIYGDPEKEENFTIGINGAEGDVTYKYHIQVLTKGDFNIPPMEVTYFDPKSEQYVTLTSNQNKIKVLKDPSIKDVNDDPESSEKDDSDELVLNAKEEDPSGHFSWHSILLFGLPTLSLAFLLLLILRVKKKKEETMPDTPEIPVIDHNKNIRDHFRQAVNTISSNDLEFYTHIQKCIHLLFLDQMKLSEGVLTKEQILDWLTKNDQEEKTEDVSRIFSAIEISKYGIASSSEDKETLLNQLSSLLKSFNYSVG